MMLIEHTSHKTKTEILLRILSIIHTCLSRKNPNVSKYVFQPTMRLNAQLRSVLIEDKIPH